MQRNSSSTNFSNAPSVISQELEAIAHPFGAMATEVFNNLPKIPSPGKGGSSSATSLDEKSRIAYENTLFEFLDRPIVSEGEIGKVIQNASFIASPQPDTSFAELVAILPSIIIDETDAPQKPKTVSVLTYLQNVQWDNTYHRAIFQYLIDSIICIFLHKLLLLSKDKIEKENCINIFHKVIDIWYPTDPHPAFYERLRLINWRLWAHIIYILSCRIPQETADQMIKRMPEPKNSDIATQIYLELFQWIYIGNESNLNYTTLPDKFKTLEFIAKRSKTNGPIHAPAMNFFTNLMGYLLVAHPPYRELQFTFDLSEVAKGYTTEKGYIGPAYSLRALLYRFTKHKKMKLNLEEYSKKYIEKRFIDQLAPYHLESYLFFIRGHNYAAQCQLEVSEENYKWRFPPKENDMAKYIFAQVINNPSVYADAQQQLGDFLVQYASNDFASFVRTELVQITKKEFAQPNLYALFILAHRVLSRKSKFSEYAQNGTDQTSISQFKSDIGELVQELLAASVTKLKVTEFPIYGVLSFVDSLNLCKPTQDVDDESTVQNKLYTCIHLLATNSSALKIEIQRPKMLMPREKQKWTKLMVKGLDDLVFDQVSTQSSLQLASSEIFVSNQIIMGIAILPLLGYDEGTVRKLVGLIFTQEQHIGSIALRVLQIFIHQDKKWLNTILTVLCTAIAPTQEYLFLQIQAIECIIQSGLFVHADINDETLQLVFQTIILAFCSSEYFIRSRAFDLSSSLSKLCKKAEPDFSSFIESKSVQIDQQIQKLAISVGSFNIDNDLSDCGTFSFELILRSAMDCLYFFAISALSNAFAGSPLKKPMDKAKTSLVNALSGIGKNSKIMRINIFILLAGFADKSLVDFLKTSNDSIQAAMNALESKKMIPYAAYYTAIPQDIGIYVIPLIVSSDPFLMQTVTYVMRTYITESIAQQDFVVNTGKTILDTYRHLKIVSQKIQFSANTSTLNNDNLLYSMCHFLIALYTVYNKKFADNAVNPVGPYAQPKRILFAPDSKSTEPEDVMFTFLMNLSCLDEKQARLKDCQLLSRATLDAFIKIYHIPNELFNMLSENLTKIAQFSFTSVVLILKNFFLDIIPAYLQNSATDAVFFKAIASQYEDCDTASQFLKVWSSTALEKMSLTETHFSSTTFMNTGRLLALAFLNLSSIQTDDRKNGFQVLFNVILGSILIHDPKAHIGPLIKKLVRLRSLIAANHPQLSENLLIQISTLARKELVFCAEQFIISAFELLKEHQDNMVFLSVIVPWVDGLVLNRSENGIVVGCEKEFTCISTFKFFQMFVESVVSVPLNRAHVQMIDQILVQPSADKISTLEFFIMSLYRLQQASEANANKCIAVLAYCLAKKQKKVINYISQYLTFKSWFYHQIQLSRIDLAFDMDKFMDSIISANESESANGISKNRSTINMDIDDDDSVALYDIVVKFSIRVFLAFMKENKTCISRVVHTLLLFCLANYESFDRTPTQLLKVICGEMRSDSPMLLHSFSSALITQSHGSVLTNAQSLADDINHLATLTNASIPTVAVAVQYIFSLPNERQQMFCQEALKWAIGCGELQIATRAAKLFLMFMTESDEEIVKILIRTIHIVTSILTERTDPSYRSAANFITVIVEKSQPNYQLAIEYLTILLQIVDKSQKYLSSPNEDGFYLAVSFLSFRESIQMPLVSAALELIMHSLENEEFANKIITKDKVDNFLRPLLEMNHSTLSIELSYKLISFLTVKYPEALVSKKDINLLISIVMPYAFTNQHDPEVRSIMKSLAKLAAGSDEQLSAELKKPFSGSADDFCKPIMIRLMKNPQQSINAEDIARIIKFYSSISTSMKSMFAPVVSICTTFLSNASFSEPIELFAEIGSIAIHDHDTSRNTLVLDFLSSLNNRNGVVQTPKISKTMKKMPEIRFRTPIDVASWAPTEGADPFALVRDYPPLSIIDLDYIGCSFQKPISVVVQQVKVEPFSTWTAAMFRAESFQVQCDNVVNESLSVSNESKEIFDLFARALTGEFDDDEEETSAMTTGSISGTTNSGAATSSSTAARQKLLRFSKEKAKNATATGEGSQSAGVEGVGGNAHSIGGGIQIAFLSTSEFTPNTDEIDKLGADILDGIDVPSFFPTDLR